MQAELDGALDVLRRQVQLAAGGEELVVQLAELLAQVALETQASAQVAGLVLGVAGVEAAAAAEHGLFHLVGDDRADLAEVLADLLDLEHGAHQEFVVGFQGAGSLAACSGSAAAMLPPTKW